MGEYNGNSDLQRQQNQAEKKAVKQVVNGAVRKSSNGIGDKVAKFFGYDSVGDVRRYIFTDVLMPSVKKFLLDAIAMLPGGVAGGNRPNTVASRTSYTTYSSSGVKQQPKQATVGYVYDDIEYPTRTDAEEVLVNMTDMLSTYGTVSVMDMYDLSGLTTEYTASKYGWDDISRAYVEKSSNGFIIRLPKIKPLN